MTWPMVTASELILKRGGSVNPSKFPEETFELLSIPAFDKNEPEILLGSEIGSSKSCIEPGDVLLSKIVPHIRRCWVVPEKSEYRQIGSGEWIIFRDDRFDKGFLKHFLTSDIFHRQFMNTVAGVGGSLVRARPAEVERIEIPLPPLAEQKRIAAILDKADAIRRKRQQAIQLADDFLRAVFLDMFGSSVEKSRWQEVRFDEVVLIDAKMVDPREEEYLDLLHIGPDRIEKNTGKLLPALTAREENLISKKFLFDHSYVLYSKIRPYLRKVALPDFVGLCSADMYPVRPKDSYLTREFLWQLLLSDDFTNYTETLPGRANIPKLNRNELANYCFKLPPIDLQEKFTAIFKKQNQSYVYSKSAMEMSDSAFGALSQKAFSGEL